MTDTDEGWWCASGEPQSRHHLFTRCWAWAPQARRLWKDIGEACEWEHLRTPSARLLWNRRATEVALEFLGTMRVGCKRAERVPPEDRGGQ